ncbi:MAPKAPK5 [Symbiodinium sp. KB8]|nr:MAPKAPK5 [Symbiodinium sp. KB8]
MREWMLQIAHALAFAHSQGVAHRDVKLENILLFTHTRAAKPHATLPQATAHRHAHLAALRALASQVLPHGTLSTDTSHALRQYMVKLCDFGSAFVAAEDAPPGTARGMSPQGSTPFSCPEIVCLYTAATSPETASACWPTDAAPVTLGKEGYNPYAADVWSFGVTLFVMACGHTPFRAAAPFSRTFRAFVASTQPHVLHDDIMGPQSTLWAEGGHLPHWHWPQGMSPALAHLLGGCLAVRAEERLSMEEVKAHAWFTKPTWTPAVTLQLQEAVTEPPTSGAGSHSVATSSPLESGSLPVIDEPRGGCQRVLHEERVERGASPDPQQASGDRPARTDANQTQQPRDHSHASMASTASSDDRHAWGYEVSSSPA